ncbi:phage tail tape measure protein [[Clostridium] sordellii]|uniref:phage tail tape measure protein n=1 Tax=Paraclostridium sordellii TaxID=1505 RepID=UPI0005DDDD80|nr:phage tail tape measure protein [Paeniclostridium sordellii]MDU2148213.1 phage tail tape measure protein [Paeniclostridium sordellii]CEP89824.1 phage tail tape measure protein [[Clostridium] sordellii] [Paeniclostridium sordellii]CEQ20914.1 phage tail tape measure protein [[Clostridium] sordellii] [Paeniclostridium sordellii]CEQ30272.1 phage tail tape measure protein [[Clostridium] sordellii] [Paeniclostridium sordellii]
MASGIELAPLVCEIRANLDDFNRGIDEATQGSSRLEEQFKQLNNDSRLAESGFKLAGASAALLGDKIGILASKQNELSDKIKLQSRAITLAKHGYDQAQRSLTSYTDKSTRLKEKLNDLTREHERVENSFGKNSRQAKSLQREINKLNVEYDRNKEAVDKAKNNLNNYNIKLNETQTELLETQNALNETNEEIKKTRLSNINEKIEKVSGKLKDLGSTLTSKVTLPILKVGKASFTAAMDLDDNLGKTDSIFRENSETVKDWSNNSLESMGMCQSSALELANKFGDMGLSMKLTSKDTTDYAINLAQLAADMSSYKNITIERANEALTGIYTGETKALKELGITMTDANLQQFASNEGIKKKINNMTQAELVQLRYNYVMSKTKDMQNDFASGNDGASNSLKIFSEATKELSSEIGTGLLPTLTPMIQKATEIVKSFASMDEGTRNLILKLGLFAVAAGPVLTGLGTGIELISKTSIGLGLLGGISLPLVGTVAGVAAGVAAIGYAGYKTAEYLNSSATPAVDLFADKVEFSKDKFGNYAQATKKDVIKISKATKDSVKSYLDLDKKASESMMSLKINSNKFTKATKDSVINNFTEMSKKSSNLSKDQKEKMTVEFKKLVTDTGHLTKKNKDEIIRQYASMVNGTKGLTKKQKDQTIKDFRDTLNQSTGLTKKQSQDLQKIYTDMSTKIKDGLDKKRDIELKSQKGFFDKSNALSTKEEAQILSDTEKHWNEKKVKIDGYQKKINDIIQKASEEHRQISDKESSTIDEIQKKMKENAVKTLSANEVESKVILERMKDYDKNITAEMASKHIKELNKSRDKSIEAANSECDQRISEIIRMRDESKVISADQAKKLIEDAKKQRDDTVKAAKDTRNQAVEQITSMNSNIKKDVDTTTGEVKSTWDKMKDWWENWHPVKKVFDMITREPSPSKTGFHYNGLDYVPYDGYIARLHKGERVLTAEENGKYSEVRTGSTVTQDININIPVILEDRVIAKVVDKIQGKNLALEKRLVGR